MAATQISAHTIHDGSNAFFGHSKRHSSYFVQTTPTAFAPPESVAWSAHAVVVRFPARRLHRHRRPIHRGRPKRSARAGHCR
ncbi:hypothetical protein [Bradyrhizobium arachidis]|uniref:RIFT barrel domain-containing protein n=1 Tax=Bradyrhizobium arachidis TaxID=858423 RepID=UPI003D32383B